MTGTATFYILLYVYINMVLNMANLPRKHTRRGARVQWKERVCLLVRLHAHTLYAAAS